MSQIVFRPIDVWPGTLRPDGDRKTSPFQAEWRKTERLLRDEVDWVGRTRGEDIILQVAADERAMRVDGGLRADAQPTHPGVIVSFDSKHGPLRYHTDVFRTWQGNVRAVALGLEALRRIERYGIAGAGEQYRGWNALPPAREMGAAMTVEEAVRVLTAEAGYARPIDPMVPADISAAYRRAAAKHHPDAGGDPAVFRRVTQARDLLTGGT